MWRCLMASLSCMCCEAKLPFLRNSSFTHKNAILIAIINALKKNISAILYNFAGTKVVQVSGKTK